MKISPPLPPTATNISNVEDDILISRHYRTFLWNEITKEIRLGKGIVHQKQKEFEVHQNSSFIKNKKNLKFIKTLQ